MCPVILVIVMFYISGIKRDEKKSCEIKAGYGKCRCACRHARPAAEPRDFQCKPSCAAYSAYHKG